MSQVRGLVGPDLGPNCLQRFSADDKDVTVGLFMSFLL